MDMKRILEKLDQASAKPAVADSNDMKKFMTIVTEGANPHKVALPVQMAMQHYQESAVPAKTTQPSLLKKYFAEAEEVVAQAETERKEHLKMYAQTVAKRVLENRYKSYNDELGSRERDEERAMGRGERDMDDESNLLYIYVDGRVKQKMVSNRVEKEARQQGFRDTPEQALKMHGIIRSKFNPKKWVQKHGDQWAEVHPFGNAEGVNEETPNNTNTYFVDTSSGTPVAKTSPRPTAIVASKLWFDLTPDIEEKARNQGFTKIFLSVNGQTVPGVMGGDQKLGSKIIVTPRDYQSMVQSARAPKE